jgi:hypothetical protein
LVEHSVVLTSYIAWVGNPRRPTHDRGT